MKSDPIFLKADPCIPQDTMYTFVTIFCEHLAFFVCTVFWNTANSPSPVYDRTIPCVAKLSRDH